MLKKIFIALGKIILHLAAAAVIFYFFLAVAKWYFDYPVILGVDFFNTVSHIAYLLQNFALRVFGYRYIWWGGIPMYVGTPDLMFYLILPFTKFYNIISLVKLFVLGALFLFLFFSYLLFNRLSKNPVLSVILTIFVTYSLSLYGSLIWGGGLLYFSAQLFLPLILYFIVGFRKTKKIRQLIIAALLNGISFYVHPQLAITLTFPMVILMLFFAVDDRDRFFSWKKFSYLFIFILISILVGYFQIYSLYPGTPFYHLQVLLGYLSSFIGHFTQNVSLNQHISTPQISPLAETNLVVQDQINLESMQRTNFGYIFQRTYPGLFVFLIITAVLFLIGLIFSKKGKLFEGLSYLSPLIWSILYLSMFILGLDFYHGGIYRAYWYLPLILGLTISFFSGIFQENFLSFKVIKKLRIKNFNLIYLVILLITAVCGYFIFVLNPLGEFFQKVESPKFRQQSSAYPEIINTIKTQSDLDILRNKLVPSWLPVNSKNYRLYEADQRVSIWWNTFFDLPLVTGYLDMPLGGGLTGTFYWIASSLTNNSLVEDWKVPLEVSKNNAFYLLDWFSIKYLELAHVNSDSYNVPSSYIDSSIIKRSESRDLNGWIQLYELPDGQKLIFSENSKQNLNYYEIKDEFVSPIFGATNSKTIGIVAPFSFYETVFRAMAIININSQEIIPVFLGESLNNIKEEDFNNLDALFLYGYKNSNNSIWEKLDKYVTGGGKLLIETGSDVPQTNSNNLPDVFPINSTKKEDAGDNWSLKIDPEIGQSLNKDKFAPPVLENKPWQFSNGKGVREGAKILLSQKNTPLIVTRNKGNGRVIWSGMNLVYHAEVNHNLDEGQMFKNILLLLTGFERQKNLSAETTEILAEKANFSGIAGKGVLFKEQNWKNWIAQLKANNKISNLKIYSSGPTYPGFLYVRIPDQFVNQEIQLEFSYRPAFLTLFYFIISILSIILVFDYCFLDGKLTTPLIKKISKPLSKKVTKWWNKDDDDE